MDDIETLAAKQALRELVALYCRAIDRGDADLLVSLLHDDAEIDAGPMTGRGAEIARRLIEAVRTGYRACWHHVGGSVFAVAGERAVGETYVLARTLSRGEPAERGLMGGRYLDRFERRDGVWRIAARRFVPDWAEGGPAGEPHAGIGGWGADDPSSGLFDAP